MELAWKLAVLVDCLQLGETAVRNKKTPPKNQTDLFESLNKAVHPACWIQAQLLKLQFTCLPVPLNESFSVLFYNSLLLFIITAL